jgi:hypothetical protein
MINETGMKRIHLFEFEDFNWFPDWLRKCLTRMMVVMHKLLHTSEEMAALVERGLKSTGDNTIIDLCSGSGGPMPEVVDLLNQKGLTSKLIMTDLFPNQEYASSINMDSSDNLKYMTDPVDASNVSSQLNGLRTMVGSLHHMKPEVVKKILQNAMNSKQPFLAFEISDNSYPKALWWIAIPFNIIASLFVSAFARPYSFQQFFFTYLCPLIPITFAWDGAVSNARTYTLDDLDILLKDVQSEDYTWEKGIVKGKSKKIYLLGLPRND